jgi:hypothetical protein
MKQKHRRVHHSPVSYFSAECRAGTIDVWSGVVVCLLNLECPQQNRANENEHGAHGEHIPSQGKVHGSASLVEVVKS